jgi:hypothetical protein
VISPCGVPLGQRTLVARRIGYLAGSKAVSRDRGRHGARSRSTASALNLTEVVVTGSAAPTERRKLGTSIASVDSTTSLGRRR